MQYTAVTTQYTDEAVAREYDRVRFSDPFGRLFDVMERRALKGVLTRVRREIPAPRVLDVPCGTGRITRVWLEAGLTVTGGDISPAMIRVAKEKCAPYGDRVTFEEMDLDRYVCPDGKYDLVTCIRLLHHLESADRSAVLSKLAQVTSRFVMVNLPYSSTYYRARRSLKRWLRQGVSRTAATWAQINDETSRAGLRIVYSRFMAPLLSENLILLLERKV